MERILTVIAAITVTAGVAFAGYDYQRNHIPAFLELESKVDFQQCVQQCKATCQRNNIPLDQCDCSDCHVYKVQ